MSLRAVVAVCLLLTVVAPWLSPPGLAQPTQDDDLRLQLAPDMDVANTTLFIGRLATDAAERHDPAFVGVTRIALPAGTLSVCAVDGTTDRRALLRSLTQNDAPCDDPEVFEDPQLAFGPRSWLQFAGTYRSLDTERPGLHMLSTGLRQLDNEMAAIPANGSLAYGMAANPRFQSLIPATEVRVETEDGTTSFNGTDWRFHFDGDGRMAVSTEGVLERVETPFFFDFGPMSPALVRRSLEPRVLLDLQEVVVGPDHRAPVSAVTAHFDLSRAPPLLNGALVGHLNGTIDGRDLSGRDVAHARYGAVALRYDNGVLRGDGEADFVLTTNGLVQAGRPDGSPPWVLSAVLWVSALLATLGGRRVLPAGAWQRALEGLVPVVAFLAWDHRLGTILGASGLDLLGTEYGSAAALRLLLFEVLGLLLALVLVYLPVRIIGRRVAPPKWSWTAPVVAALVLLGFVVFFEQDLVAATLVFARF